MNIGSLGFGKSKTRSSQEIWGPQADFLKQIYGVAGNLMGNDPYLNQALAFGGSSIPGISDATSGALPAWQNLLSGGTFGGQQWDPSGVQNLAMGQGPSFDTLYGLQNPAQNPYLSAMAQSGLGEMFKNFNQNVMPSLTNSADMSGGLGGSRQGVAQGLATQGLLDSGSRYLTNLYGGQYQSDMDRSLAASQAALASQMNAFGLMNQFGQGADQTALNALGQGSNAVNLGFTAPNLYNTMSQWNWQPYMNAAAIAGSPTVLGTTQGDTMYGNIGFGKQA